MVGWLRCDAMTYLCAPFPIVRGTQRRHRGCTLGTRVTEQRSSWESSGRLACYMCGASSFRRQRTVSRPASHVRVAAVLLVYRSTSTACTWRWTMRLDTYDENTPRTVFGGGRATQTSLPTRDGGSSNACWSQLEPGRILRLPCKIKSGFCDARTRPVVTTSR